MLNIWVGNLGKYNEGELKGGWLELPKEKEEITVQQVGRDKIHLGTARKKQ